MAATARTPLKPLTDAIDSAVSAIPGTGAGAGLGAPTTDVTKRAMPAVYTAAGVIGGWMLEKSMYTANRGLYGYADRLTQQQRNNRNMTRAGLATVGIAVAAVMDNPLLQFVGLGVAGVGTAHLVQDAIPTLK